MSFHRDQKSLNFQGSTPLPHALVMDLPALKALHTVIGPKVTNLNVKLYIILHNGVSS
jgi:hypothetical protein